ncbi:hypothetical protein N7E70_028730 (plasmid) [Aminobacter sp. NyZ550]|jgi:hypothetical protein|uniref:Uncharacterized protein n=2 Tax=Aminobacter TaxID=31988 RepID=A0ABR6H1Q8_AMIAI|nr:MULTISPECIES: hypothetical protein [Aminobacter]MBA8908097.1 hypothetical protein [Aminobacter ciceronei]MBA9021919.1 hypothetical protein [Aminobacter ciceronei]MBB3704448.1 hypothetical protein [Aminobacter aminovorans]QOF74555.1 hypothetical protein IG197_29935 [Aminobacter sp. SR38]WAX98102.1 hypothetical protein N7E70_028730 [Aminobacter sp. NyZ550]
MKTASTFLQLLALSACLVARVLGAGDMQTPGVRRALQTMAGAGRQTITECLTAQA